VTWLVEQCVDGEVVVRLGRRGDEFVAEFSNLGTLSASAQGTRMRFEPVAHANTTAIEKLDVSKLDALIRHLRGKFTLHGGAVALGRRAVAFVGPSRSGKSTLAAALCEHAEAELVGDDTVALELPEELESKAPVEVAPTQKLAWLLQDARIALGFDSGSENKASVPLRPATADRFVIAAVVGLAFDSAIQSTSLRRLRGQEAFALVTGSVMRFVVDEPEAQVREFEQVRRLVQSCPVFELRRPFDLRLLRQAADVVCGLIGDAGSPERGS
jgi:hypothetical protein